MTKLTIVIPVYNEAENIIPEIEALEKEINEDYIINVIYDNDADTTIPVVKKMQEKFSNIYLIKNKYGRGVLNAIKTGLESYESEYTVVTMADLSDPPEVINKMLEKADNENADIVCASRYMKGGKQVGGPFLKGLMSRCAGLSLKYLAGVDTHDGTNSFKLYRTSFLKEQIIESTGGFELGLELVVKAHLQNKKICEVPTVWTDRVAGKSNFKIIEWLPSYLRWYFTAYKKNLNKLCFYTSAFLFLFTFLLSFIILSNCTKIKFNAEVINLQKSYQIEYISYIKVKEKTIKPKNNCIKNKFAISTKSFKVNNLNLPDIKSMSLDKYKITSFNQTKDVMKKIRRDYIGKNILLSLYNAVFAGAFLYILYALYLLCKLIKHIVYKISNIPIPDKILKTLNKSFFYFSLMFLTILLVKFLNYPILDFFYFRQTQTALNTLCIAENFNISEILNYKLPILGYPWSCPFEFPVYQTICAFFAKFCNIPLDATGRIVSFIFTVLTLYPIKKLCERFIKDKEFFYLIGGLYLFSPLYCTYSRTFMIESTAFFFCAMFLYQMIKYFDENKNINLFGMAFCATLGGLAKVTTLFGFVYVAIIYFIYKLFKKEIALKTFICSIIAGLISLCILICWNHYSEAVRALNPIANHLNTFLMQRNFGELVHRKLARLHNAMMLRMNIDILGSYIVLIISAVCWLFIKNKYKIYSAILFLVYLAVIMTFPVLHMVHNYYQLANGIFLIGAFAIILWGLYESNRFMYLVLFITTIYFMTIQNYGSINITNSIKDNDTIRTCNFVKEITAPSDSIIAIGTNWSSHINYYTNRKGVAIPNFIPNDILNDIIEDATKFNGGMPMKAIVYFDKNDKFFTDIKNKFLTKYKPKQAKTYGKYTVYYGF